ncbi:MAG: hypothetical protein KKH88_03605 [Nanoarchaeota archaeon]|nr:hypothetical protein [Nanoarchaeota archaeon]
MYEIPRIKKKIVNIERQGDKALRRGLGEESQEFYQSAFVRLVSSLLRKEKTAGWSERLYHFTGEGFYLLSDVSDGLECARKLARKIGDKKVLGDLVTSCIPDPLRLPSKDDVKGIRRSLSSELKKEYEEKYGGRIMDLEFKDPRLMDSPLEIYGHRRIITGSGEDIEILNIDFVDGLRERVRHVAGQYEIKERLYKIAGLENKIVRP